ncbi:MAG: GDP-mannose 4,6-dehydratase [Chloroflexi bacterium]|nr:GDP-mannose 4,6-dehydratase [Chloroflexota bacterium]
MRALITGISGFAGSHLAEYLLDEKGSEVWGTFRGNYQNIEHIKGRLRLLSGDLRDAGFVGEVLDKAKPEYIFHLAAQSYVPQSWQNPWETLENNLRPQANILQGVVKRKIATRILVVGSNEEYGRVQPKDLPIKENFPLRPDNPYGVSKVAQDLLGLQYHLSHGLEVMRVRPFNHTGPRQKEHFVIPSFAKQIAEIEKGVREPVVMVGNLEAQRDFSDVRDVVRGYYLAISKGKPGEVYNIASGAARSIGQSLQDLLRLTSKKIEVAEDPALLRPADVPISMGDASQLRERTGWKPSIPWERTLQDTLDYWRKRVA